MMIRPVLPAADIRDEPESWPIRSHTIAARGAVSTFVDDEIATPDGGVVRRQYLRHPGAVGIVAWDERDGRDQIVVVRQYRPAVGFRLVEPPAGLLDHDGEAYVDAARREMAEETGLAARRWQVLADVFSTPGASEESVRVFLARELSEVGRPADFVLEGEEAAMDVCWAGRADLLDAIFDGRLQNPTMVIGVLALETARLTGRLDLLRTADAPWPAREVRRARHDA